MAAGYRSVRDRSHGVSDDGGVHLVAAPDKFRGTVTAAGAAHAIARAAIDAGWTCDEAPLADGGEGTLDVLGGPNRSTVVTGPLGEPVDAAWRLDGRHAVIEMAEASGLALCGEATDAVAATTRGTGELIAAALGAGAKQIVVCLGGSATTDGGLGAIEALQVERLRGVDLVVACDVRTRFVDAAADFAPQKGASPAQVALLTRRLQRLVDLYRSTYGVDVGELPGAGAAGGLAGGLVAVGARLVSGFDLVAERVGLEERLERADLVVTGEGMVDDESFAGKVVGGVAAVARHAQVPVLVVCGAVHPSANEAIADLAEQAVTVRSLVDAVGEARAHSATADAITEVVATHLAALTTRS